MTKIQETLNFGEHMTEKLANASTGINTGLLPLRLIGIMESIYLLSRGGHCATSGPFISDTLDQTTQLCCPLSQSLSSINTMYL